MVKKLPVFNIIRTTDFIMDTSEKSRLSLETSRLSVATAVDEEDEELGISKIDLNFGWNCGLHNTSLFNQNNNQKLVIRRGQKFKITLSLNMDLILPERLSFLFKLADCTNPDFGNGTLAIMDLKPTAQIPSIIKDYWSAIYDGKPKRIIDVEIYPALNCNIGRWRFVIYHNGVELESCNNDIYIIFNPWLKGEQCYLSDKKQRIEYVLRDIGGVVVGSATHPEFELWSFSQYDKDILDSIFYMLYEDIQLSFIHCSDIIQVTKALMTSILHPLVKDYIFSSKREYDTTCSSSSFYLKQYFHDKKPIDRSYYLVEIGILVTIFRALGIPARIVTGFDVIQRCENDGSTTFDKYFSINNHPVTRLNEKYWYFRPWVELFMQRKDLGNEFGGWQYATEAGPASVYSIKMRHLEMPYGTNLVFNSINSEILMWEVTWERLIERFKLIECIKSRVGKTILTKQVDSWEIEDISATYVLEEGLPALDVYEPLNNHFWINNYFTNPPFTDVHLSLIQPEEFVIGQPLSVSLKYENLNKSKMFEVSYILTVEAVLLDGTFHQMIKEISGSSTEKSWLAAHSTVTILPSEYMDKLDLNHGLCRITWHPTIQSEHYSRIFQETFRIRPPQLTLTVSLKEEDSISTVTINLTNPTKNRRKGKLSVVEFKTNHSIMLKEELSAQGQMSTTIQLRLLSMGVYVLIASYKDDAIMTKGFIEFTVQQ